MTNEITKGQKVTVTGMKTECKFSHYLPVVTWSKKAKPRCVVLVGSGEWEMEVFVSEVSAVQTPDQVEAAHAEAIQINTMMDTAWPLPVSVFIEGCHAEALEMDVTYSAIIADRNATLELSRALGRDVLQKSIVMLKCQTVGEVSGEVKEGDTVTVSLQDQNGNKITVTGEVEEILE